MRGARAPAIARRREAPGCLNLFLPAWTLDSEAKFAGACLGVFSLGVGLEGLARLRRTRKARACEAACCAQAWSVDTGSTPCTVFQFCPAESVCEVNSRLDLPKERCEAGQHTGTGMAQTACRAACVSLY